MSRIASLMALARATELCWLRWHSLGNVACSSLKNATNGESPDMRLSLSFRTPVGSSHSLNFMASPATRRRQRSPSIIPGGFSLRMTASIAASRMLAMPPRETGDDPKTARESLANSTSTAACPSRAAASFVRTRNQNPVQLAGASAEVSKPIFFIVNKGGCAFHAFKHQKVSDKL